MVFLDYLNDVHNYNSLIPNAFEYCMDKSNLTMQPYNSQFDARGITNQNIILLVGSDLQILALALLILFFLEIIPITDK